jgi:predicted small lipoprotein YifL
MTRFVVALVAISFVGLFAGGCGQSGPLYLPGNPSKLERLPPAPRESDEEEDKSKDGDASSP